MSTIEELEECRADLEAVVLDVLGTVFNEEAVPVWDGELPPGPLAVARLAIHDEDSGAVTGVMVRAGAGLARLLASRMLFLADPAPEDLLDAVGELGNIAGGNVKTMLYRSARLSLPDAEVTDPGPEPDLVGIRVHAAVLGHVVELAVTLDAVPDGYRWPPVSTETTALESN